MSFILLPEPTVVDVEHTIFGYGMLHICTEYYVKKLIKNVLMS
jgi:hypothetical protein